GAALGKPPGREAAGRREQGAGLRVGAVPRRGPHQTGAFRLAADRIGHAAMRPALLAALLMQRHGDFTAADGIALAVQPGESVGLAGPNGAGKTTTLRMLAGILSPTEGRVLIGGVDLAERPLEAKQRIGFLSGDTQLYQRLTPREVLRYFGRLYG